jgi:hypothetical protein
MFDKLWLNYYNDLFSTPGSPAGSYAFGGENLIINNYAIGLSGYYLTSNNITIRIKAQIAANNIKSSDNIRDYITSSPPQQGQIFTNQGINAKQTIMSFEPSVVWNNKIKKITIYEGLTLPFILIGKYQSSYHAVETDLSNAIISSGTSDNSLPGGFATGLGIVSGFDLSISNRLRFGMELSCAYLYSHVDGKQTLTTGTILPTYAYETATGPFTRIRYEFSNINAAINISYSF